MQCLTPMSNSMPPKAFVSITENMIPKKVGERTQPCFTPFEPGNGLDVVKLA